MIIAFPPCTDLANSGARHFEKKRQDGRQKRAADFFMMFIEADCPRIAVESDRRDEYDVQKAGSDYSALAFWRRSTEVNLSLAKGAA
jgi:hypothetical protein